MGPSYGRLEMLVLVQIGGSSKPMSESHTPFGEAGPAVVACYETYVEDQENREKVVYDGDCDRSTVEPPFELLERLLDEAAAGGQQGSRKRG